MDGGARGWLLRTARKNYWRVSSWYDLDDLIQEGYAAYYDTIRRYPDATDPPHRMALFKRVFMSRLTDMANQRTRRVPEVLFSEMTSVTDDGSETSFLDTLAAETDLSVLLGRLSGAPQCVRDALALFAGEEGLRRLRSAYRRVRSGERTRRETFNERLCRLTGYDSEETNIIEALRAYLSN